VWQFCHTAFSPPPQGVGTFQYSFFPTPAVGGSFYPTPAGGGVKLKIQLSVVQLQVE